MVPVLRLSLVLAVLYVCTDAYLPRFFLGRLREGFVRPPDLSSMSKSELMEMIKNPIEAQWFEQKLDHFNSTDKRTWKQLYYTAGPKSSDTLFVMIGGEGSISEGWMYSGMWTKYAEAHNGVRLQLEHRYYGQSHPTPNLSLANLRFLSSEQALADLASFISAKKAEFGAKKVIVIGGSYSGNLAAWFRRKYPHLADGALATSAPVLAQVNFKGYLEVVSNSLNYYNPACSSAVSDATKAFKQKMQTADGRKELKKMFNLCADIDINNKDDIASLYEALAGNFMGVVQYNLITPGPTAADLCDSMTDKSVSDILQRYAITADLVLEGRCLDFKYQPFIDELKKEDWKSAGASVGMRQWIYQTCSEFGYYQSSDSNAQPFGHDFPIEFCAKMCADVYGPQFTLEFISGAVNKTNRDFGGRNYTDDRVVFTNGNIDPWHYLSITHKLPKVPVIYINGTAHCANMYQENASDPPGLKQARKTIAQLITKWLQ